MPLGYPLPDPLDNGARICVRVDVPNVPEHRRAFISAVKSLTEWFAWQRDDAKQGRDAASVWRPVLDSVIAQLSGDSDCTDCETEPCKDYAPDHPLIEYWPNDPFRTPEYKPENYDFPPWYHNALVAIQGVRPSDAMVNGLSININGLSPQAIIDFYEILTGNPGFPNVTINCYGQGQVEVELVKIIQGGLAVTIKDDDPLTIQFISLNAQNLTEILNIEFILELLSGGDTGETVNTEVVEFNFDTTGPHNVKIIFLPLIGTDVGWGFGGGIRRVTLCGLSVLGSPEMFKLRQNAADNCLLEQSLDGGQTWSTAFDYDLCKPVTKIYRYTTINNTTVYQESSDGGQTWQDAPNVDPRHIGSTTPSGDRCRAADGVVKVIQQEVATIVTSANEQGATVISIIKAVLEFLKFFGGQWLEAWLIPLIQSILDGGIQSFADAFTQQVWDALLCAALEADSGGVYSVDAWNQVKTNISNDLPAGIAKDHIWRVVDMMGAAGITNAGGLGSSAANCADCVSCTNYDLQFTDILIPSVAGQQYRFTFSGTLVPTTGGNGQHWADAWGYSINGGTPARTADGQYECVLVDGQPIDSAYNDTHVYVVYYTGTGQPFAVRFNELYPPDNSGGPIHLEVCAV